MPSIPLRLDTAEWLPWLPGVRQRVNGFTVFPDAGKDRSWEEKGTTEDEMVGWHYRFNGHEF